MAIREILLLGNPGLLTKCEPILSGEIEFTKSIGQDLRDTMQAFRAEHGWGRAIAAPQIGIKKQIVFMEEHSSILFINPVISAKAKKVCSLLSIESVSKLSSGRKSEASGLISVTLSAYRRADLSIPISFVSPTPRSPAEAIEIRRRFPFLISSNPIHEYD